MSNSEEISSGILRAVTMFVAGTIIVTAVLKHWVVALLLLIAWSLVWGLVTGVRDSLRENGAIRTLAGFCLFGSVGYGLWLHFGIAEPLTSEKYWPVMAAAWVTGIIWQWGR